LQGIDGQQQRFDLFARKLQTDGVPAAGLVWTVGTCMLSHTSVLQKRDPEHAERASGGDESAPNGRVDVRHWRGGST
jgi:hypothetical protein